MSNTTNDLIRDRARELSEECTNSMLGAQLDKAIQADDLDEMRVLSINVEQHLTYIETINDSEAF